MQRHMKIAVNVTVSDMYIHADDIFQVKAGILDH